MFDLFYHPGENTPFMYRLDPRVKLISVFSFVALVSTMASLPLLSTAAVFVLGLALFSRLPGLLLAKRLLWVLPFGGILVLIYPFVTPGSPAFTLNFGVFSLVATGEGTGRAAVLFLRVLTAVSSLTVLTATTRFRDLMDALKGLKIPVVLVQLIEFTVRYIYVLMDEVQRMRTARRARCFDEGKSLFDRRTFSTIGQLVGVLFLRSLERGERVYNAMLARGYGGELPAAREFALPAGDVFWGAGVLAFAVVLRIIEFGGTVWQISLR
ncbi:MAG: cobalt ECF transporter T component CbiQ [Firmicutes bacterium]|nr:cobalt ECF transporter T component CbiQ [Bacillota bacterium]